MPTDERAILEARLAEIQACRDSAQEEKERLVARQETAEATIERLDCFKIAIQERIDKLPP